jgi:hypothetical protein
MLVISELENARNESNEESLQEKVGQLTDMLAKYDSDDY